MRERKIFDVSDMFTIADAWGWTWERELKNKMPRKWSQEWEVELAIKIMQKVCPFISSGSGCVHFFILLCATIHHLK